MRPDAPSRRGRRDLVLAGSGAIAGLAAAAILAGLSHARLASRLDDIESLRVPIVVIDTQRLKSGEDGDAARRMMAAGQAARKLSEAGYVVLAGTTVIAAPDDVYVRETDLGAVVQPAVPGN